MTLNYLAFIQKNDPKLFRAIVKADKKKKERQDDRIAKQITSASRGLSAP
jgi:hypothetical protein